MNILSLRTIGECTIYIYIYILYIYIEREGERDRKIERKGEIYIGRDIEREKERDS